MSAETYISVDVETAGPIPAQYALLSIGACLVDDPSVSFYIELKPDRLDAVPVALAIGKFTLEKLNETGVPPLEGLQAFADWIKSVTPEGHKPIFVALNAPFDWMFVHDYFHRYLGYNPFGHSALDIKAYFMGAAGVDWKSTSLGRIMAHLQLNEKKLEHNALRDAQDQAEVYQAVVKWAREREAFLNR